MQKIRDLNIPEALVGALYFFLILCAYYLLKPLRDSSFLAAFHPNVKPLFNLFTMFILFIVAGLYSWAVKKVPGKKFLHLFYIFIFFVILIIFIYIFIFFNLLVFYFVFKFYPQYAGAMFYSWLSSANIFMVTIFWTQINGSFKNLRNHYFYVIVGLGGTAGAALGGKLTSYIVPYIGSDSLLGVAAFVLSLAYACGLWIANSSEQDSFVIPQKHHHETNFRGLLKEKYAVCIFSLVIIGTFVQSIYDFQLTTLVAQNIEKNKDIMTVFYGNLYYKLNLFSSLAQAVVAPILLFTVGPARGLYLFLALIIGTSTVLSFNNTLPVMEWVFIIFAGSGYSIIQIFREQLYIPASAKVKISYKGFIDTFGFRVGDSLAAISFVVVVTIFGFDIVRLDYLVFMSGLFAAYYLFKANKIYRRLKQTPET